MERNEFNWESIAFNEESVRSEDTEHERSEGTYSLESADERTSQDTEKSKGVRGTHGLESTDGQTSQDTQRIRASEGHSRTGERRQTDKSGHAKNPSEQGALTDWRAQTDGQVRTRKESE